MMKPIVALSAEHNVPWLTCFPRLVVPVNTASPRKVSTPLQLLLLF